MANSMTMMIPMGQMSRQREKSRERMTTTMKRKRRKRKKRKKSSTVSTCLIAIQGLGISLLPYGTCSLSDCALHSLLFTAISHFHTVAISDIAKTSVAKCSEHEHFATLLHPHFSSCMHQGGQEEEGARVWHGHPVRALGSFHGKGERASH